MTIAAPTETPRLLDDDLTRRALQLVTSGTTDMACDVLRVPLSYYRDPDLLRRERTEILEFTPLALVPSAQVPEPHDYLVRKVLGRSVLISRGGDGIARAFLNYCRHRGARPAEGRGTTRRLACPYHAWTYDSAGQLVGIPGPEGFAGTDPTDHGLVELPSEELHFVVLPGCGDGVRNGQHDHMVIGRNEIGVQHLIRTLAGDLGIALPGEPAV